MNKFLGLILLIGVFWTDQTMVMYRGKESRLTSALIWADEQAALIDKRVDEKSNNFEEQKAFDYSVLTIRLQSAVLKITGKLIKVSFDESIERNCSSPVSVCQKSFSPSFLTSPQSSPFSFSLSLPTNKGNVVARRIFYQTRDEVSELIKQREKEVILPDLHLKIIYFHIKKSLNEEIVSFNDSKKR